jgi:hypothetical protein
LVVTTKLPIGKYMTENEVMMWLKENRPDIYYMKLASDNFLKKRNVRELGKIFSEANEYIQRDWIHVNTKLKVVRNDDYTKSNVGDNYDLITSDGILKIQSKLRFSRLYIEQTRRPTKNNNINNRASSGYVRYALGESDIYLFSRPKSIERYNDIKSWDIVAIPEHELVDNNESRYLVVTVPHKIFKKYVGKTKETLENTYLYKKESFDKMKSNL